MENKKIFGILAAFVMVVTVVGFTSAQSLPDDFPVFHGFGMFGLGMHVNETAAQEIWSAVLNNNYSAWVASIESQLTQENFDRLVNMTQNMNQTRLHDHDLNWTNRTGNFTDWTMPPHWAGNFTGNWTDSDGDHAGNWSMPGRNEDSYKGSHIRGPMMGFFGRNKDN